MRAEKMRKTKDAMYSMHPINLYNMENEVIWHED